MNALQQIQQKLKVPKSQYNSFGKYSFRNQEDILEAVKPLLTEHKAVLTLSDGLVDLCGRVFVKATAKFKADDVTEEVDGYAEHAIEQKGMACAQITGSASSYARKYALNGLFLIDDAKDDDNKAPDDKKDKGEPPKTDDAKQKIKKEWLNPGTKAWENAVILLKSGTPIDVIKATYLISKANETKLIEEGK